MMGSIVDVGDDAVVAPALVRQRVHSTSGRFRHFVDMISAHTVYRWIGTLALALIYALRLYYVGGFYVVTFTLGTYLILLIVSFSNPLRLKPDEPFLPIKDSDEYKPPLHYYSEFKCWYCFNIAICIAFILTFYPKFDFFLVWQFLLIEWFVVSVVLLISRTKAVYKYDIFNFRKKKYGDVKPSSSHTNCLAD